MPLDAPDIPDLAGRRVVVGLSGGVDSAVAALLLTRAGARVEALHMTNWDADDAYCTAADDLQDARRLCEQLEVPLHHVNFAAEYRERVFAEFLAGYRAGRTPNPDILCNREIKFGVFREHALRLGAERIATGHYARVQRVAGDAALLKGVDRDKDQSYFLHAVGSDALRDTLFPLGGLTKPEVRRIARDAGLATHGKKDSTGICFIGERPFREFLAGYLPARPGPIVTPDGRQLGEHAGLAYYTPGQRQGLGIGGRREAGEAPWYVAAKRPETNELVVVQGEHPLLYADALAASAPHWIGRSPSLAGGLRCSAKIRYRQPDQACRVGADGRDRLRVEFDVPQRAIAPGQYVVFYDGERCLGGAVIDAALHDARAGRAASA